MKTALRTRTLSAIALAATGALALAGCGSSGGDADTGGTVTLTFSSWLPTQDQWSEIIEAFEEENPDIDIEFSRDEDYASYLTNLDNAILAGETPDLYGVQVGSSFDDYAEFALPVDDYAAGWIDGVSEGALEQTTTTDGTLAAVPLLTAGMQFYLYNQTLFEELGLSLPTDYDSLLEMSEAAREAGIAPMAMGAGDTWHSADFFVWLSNQFGEGGDIYRAASGDIPWDSDSLVAAAEVWQSLFADGIFQDGATTTTTYPSARDDYFLARRALGMPTGSWHVGATLSTSPEVPGSEVEGDAIGMAPFPTLGETDAGATSGVDFAIAVSGDIDEAKQEAAATFVEFMAVGAGQQIWVNRLQGFPVATDVDVELKEGESELAQESVALVTETMQASEYPRKLVSPGNDSLETDLGVVLQNIADGADPASELATLND
ncbi:MULTISPECIES: ABC transporter substrate-binding protein [Microbacterium]|uniref:ABC transporter substrate-binding protein n=1 Tax=Microbacterium TaxID=33882 RepID=UPI0018884113|nr:MULTISPECIES: ABC transporter substrate-binding protein [Microbacterium]